MTNHIAEIAIPAGPLILGLVVVIIMHRRETR
jgi:hypothetical protein